MPFQVVFPGHPSLRLLARAPATLALATANAAVFAWVAAHGPVTTAAMVAAGALERGRVRHGEVWRLVTAAFLHGHWAHLAMNLGVLLLAGPMLETSAGTGRFLAVYLASAVAGSALSILGQDVVAAGASGGLYGVVGALLVLHLRAMGSWRAFLRSRGAQWVLAGLAASWLAAASWRGGPDTDHLAHAGGFVAGAAAAWAMTRPLRRAWAAGLPGAGLAVLVLAAAWPRPGASRFETEEAERAVNAALRDREPDRAEALLASAAADGIRSDALAYYGGLLRLQRDDPEGALAVLEPLAARVATPLRAEIRDRTAAVAKLLAYRYYAGDGRAKDVARALRLFETSCGAGDAESCSYADAITGRARRPASAPGGAPPPGG